MLVSSGCDVFVHLLQDWFSEFPKNCECVVQVAFLELYCLPSCVYNQVTAATGGLDDQCGAELPNDNQTDLVIY